MRLGGEIEIGRLAEIELADEEFEQASTAGQV
jgi:hypothetical protein